MDTKTDNKMLNMCYAVETICGRLNGSAAEIEPNKDNFKNTTFTKKIGGRGMISSVCQKANMKDYMKQVLECEKNIKIKEGKKITTDPNPYKNIFDDVFGFMLASKNIIKDTENLTEEEKSTLSLDSELKKIVIRNLNKNKAKKFPHLKDEITQEEFLKLTDDEQKCYNKAKNKSTKKDVLVKKGTKKRVSRFQASPLINVSNRRVDLEYHICTTSDENLPYKLEVYSGIMAGIINFNLSQVGKFNISDNSEFIDFYEEDAKIEGVKDLDKNERAKRIEKTLKALEYLSIKGNQTNHLTDTKPKLIILGEYSWGNNVFQGVINKNGINFEMLKEALEQNEEYRLSNVWIGINKFFDENFNNFNDQIDDKANNKDIKTKLDQLKKEFDFIKIDNVHNTFNNYIKHMKKTLK